SNLRQAYSSFTIFATEPLREQINSVLHRGRDAIERTRRGVVQRSQAAAEATEEYVEDHPWQTIAVSAGAGFLLGLLVGRR
ncbi:YqjD family protein, partial [Pseudomonas aeruginosa]